MPTTCGFPNCKFRSRYRGQEDNRHFYRIPKRPPQLRQRWLLAIGRTEETVVSQLRICSAHFAGGEKKEGDIPVPDPQFDPPLFISLPPRGEALRYASAEQRQQRLLAKRLKLLNKTQYVSNTANTINKHQNDATIMNDELNCENNYDNKQTLDKCASNVRHTKSFGNGECTKLIDKLFVAAYPMTRPPGDDSRNNGNLSNISSCLFSVPPPSQRLNQELSPNQQQNLATFLQILAMNKGFAGLQHSFHQGQHGVPFHGISTNSTPSSAAGSTQMTAGSTTSRPLVALLDGRDCTIEMPLLKDIATVAFCDAQSTAEIHEKVLNEAVAALLYHSISLSREDLLKFKALKVVVRIGSGYHNVDVNAATELGIAICNTPMECVEETADTTMLMILNMFRKTFWLSRISQGSNARQSNNVEQLRELAAGCMRIRGSTLGLVGFGRIGVAVAMRARAFGFHVIFYDPYVTTGIEKSLNVERCDTLVDLLKRADCVSLHCPLNSETRFLLNTETILKMKYGAFLVNMSAPDLIAASVLLTALKSGHIRAAALEKYDSSSFGDQESNFLEAIAQQHNVIYTPHCAWYSDDSSKELRTAAAKEVRRALVGRFPDDLLNCVNKEALLARATSTLSGLIPNNAAGLQELAAAAFGLNVASSSSDSKVNLAALLSQNGGENSSSTSGLLFPGSGTSKTLNGNGNSHFPKETSASNTANPLLLSGLNVPPLMPSAAGDNADVVEQLNSFMSHFGSIPPEALSSLAAISSAADMNSPNNPLAGSVNNLSYQNFLMSLNPQMFLNTSQSVLGAATNSSNSRNGANVAPSTGFSAPANTFDVAGTPLAPTSSNAMTTCGGGSGRSSVSQNSAVGSAFEISAQNRMGPSGSSIKRKECSPPSGMVPAKISISNSRSVASSLAADRQNEDMTPKVDMEAGDNSEAKPCTSDDMTHLNEKNDSAGKLKAEGAEDYFKQQDSENNTTVDAGDSTSQFVDVATHQDVE